MDNQIYYTLQQDTETEIIIQKSRFLCFTKHVETEEESASFLNEIKKKHWDASHNCFAYRISETVQKASDDKEPSGTAGLPILNAIIQNKLIYTIIIVTRYFGGIKLGGSGLVRAYSQCASQAITEAGIVKVSLHQKIQLIFDYTYLNKVNYELRQLPYYVDPIQYRDTITCLIWVPIDQAKTFQQQVKTWTSGQVDVQINGLAYKRQKHNDR